MVPINLYCLDNPINQAIHHAGTHAIHNHRASNREHLRTDTQDKALGLEFHCRGGDGIGKACDGHQSPGTGMLCNIVIKAQPRQYRRNRHQCHGCGGACILPVQPQIAVPVNKILAHGADQSADPECIQAVPPQRRFRAQLLHQFFIFPFCHLHHSRLIMPAGQKILRASNS